MFCKPTFGTVPCQYAGVLNIPTTALGTSCTIWSPPALNPPIEWRFTRYNVPNLPAPTTRSGYGPGCGGSSRLPPDPMSKSSSESSISLSGVKKLATVIDPGKPSTGVRLRKLSP